jgi:hypothetical protein
MGADFGYDGTAAEEKKIGIEEINSQVFDTVT